MSKEFKDLNETLFYSEGGLSITNGRLIINTIEDEMVKADEVYFAKIREDAIIPTKEDEDAGYDVYACFDEDYIVINPNQIVMIPTGICSAFNPCLSAVAKERGSTGTKGLAIRCGVLDSGFRNEWKIVLSNVSNYSIIICKKGKEDNINMDDIKTDVSTIYPYEKAIAQVMFIPVPKLKSREISLEDLKAIPSKRGEGMLGSSGK